VRYILLDRITRLEPPNFAAGIKCVSLSDDIFADHFPGHPIMPGALIVESLAQLAGGRLEGQTNVHALLTMVDRARFRRAVRPGDKLDLVAEMLVAREDGGQVKGTASVDGTVVASAELGFALASVTHPVLLARRKEYLDIWLSGSATEP
jgi:3-hydroxymyristoyl/3-hydroxydecanoyl-(acyl carrier protein) dehydratase